MTAARELLYLPFWSAIVMAVLGSIMSFVPGAERDWCLVIATLSVAGLFIPKMSYRIASSILLLLALSGAHAGHERGIEYRRQLSIDRSGAS